MEVLNPELQSGKCGIMKFSNNHLNIAFTDKKKADELVNNLFRKNLAKTDCGSALKVIITTFRVVLEIFEGL
jgi:hypothetical protein